ncbi:MAG: amine oxidase, partial [Arthrobacter sp.]|nr:amine oxidase [Arthrobacter sp.]
MTTATELPASDPSSTATFAPSAGAATSVADRPGLAPVTMLNPDFPFSYDRYLAHPDGLG